MAVYGKLIKSVNEGESYENVSFDQLTEFIYESDNEMNLMFEKANLIAILKEENTSLAIPKSIDYSNAANPEQVKKKFSEKIKELFNKFLDWVKTAFENLKSKVTEFYLEHNLQDDFLSKWKNKVTWDNLETAKKKGWKGIPNSIGSVIEPVNINDTRLLNLYSDHFKELSDQIDKLSDCESEDSLNKIEDKIKGIINNINDRENRLLISQADKIIRDRNSSIMAGSKQNPFIGIISNSNAPDNHYYPDKLLFTNNKHFAETGQKEIKNIKVSGNHSVELVKDVILSSQKIMLNNSKENYKEDKDNLQNKINYLICKYRYTSSSLFIKLSSKAMNGMVGALWKQHKVAVQNYLLYVQAISRYCKV